MKLDCAFDGAPAVYERSDALFHAPTAECAAEMGAQGDKRGCESVGTAVDDDISTGKRPCACESLLYIEIAFKTRSRCMGNWRGK